MGFFVIFCLTVLGIGISDYRKLKMGYFDTLELQARVESQRNEIVVQHKQIQKFAYDINMLKSDLLALNNFEQRIRIVADVGDADKEFGIGGSISDDLDTGLDLREKHSSLIREMHDQISQLDLAAASQENEFETLLEHLLEQEKLLAHTPGTWPVKGTVTSKFGSRKSPFSRRKEFHKGLDIANRTGTPVSVTADGVVSFAQAKGSWGKMIIVDHGQGMTTCYAHLNKLLKKSGDTVKRGDVIAEVGNTGRSTGPHLHYEVRLNDISVDPEKYILN